MILKRVIKLFLVIWALASGQAFAQVKDPKLSEPIRELWKSIDAVDYDSVKIKDQVELLNHMIITHLKSNGVKYEFDSKDKGSFLIKVLPKSQLKGAHPLNIFAATLYEKYDKIRVEINPMKLFKQNAGALYDDETRRLTLAYDNVADLRSDSFVGHELIHARFMQYEIRGENHVYMGSLRRKQNMPPLQETYPDEFSLDELPAYFYQSLALIKEAMRKQRNHLEASVEIDWADHFLEIGQSLLTHLNSEEIKQAVLNLSSTRKFPEFSERDTHDVLTLETKSYELDVNFLKNEFRSEGTLKNMVVKRHKDLLNRAAIISYAFQKARQAIQTKDLLAAADYLSSSHDLVFKKSLPETLSCASLF